MMTKKITKEQVSNENSGLIVGVEDDRRCSGVQLRYESGAFIGAILCIVEPLRIGANH